MAATTGPLSSPASSMVATVLILAANLAFSTAMPSQRIEGNVALDAVHPSFPAVQAENLAGSQDSGDLQKQKYAQGSQTKMSGEFQQQQGYYGGGVTTPPSIPSYPNVPTIPIIPGGYPSPGMMPYIPVYGTPPSIPTYGTTPTIPIYETSPPIPTYGTSPPIPTYGTAPSIPTYGTTPSIPSYPGGGTGTTMPTYGAPSGGHGSCSFWSSNTDFWPNILSTISKISSAFGMPASPMWGGDMTLMQALNNTRTDVYSSLLRQATASLLNSYSYKKFPFTPEDVKTKFKSAVTSPIQAAAQAKQFAQANEKFI